MSTDTEEGIPQPPHAHGRAGARWGQERRLEFIDYRLRWDGQLNRSDLTGFFGISVPQASLDLSEYAKRAPSNLEYDPSTRAYRASPTYEPAFASSALECYLDDLLRLTVNFPRAYDSFLGWHPPVANIPLPWRRLDTSTVIAVVNAIRESNALRIRYQSFSGPTPLARTVTPHALVSNGYRWHMRAYCHVNRDYRDFLLSRVLEIEDRTPDQSRGHDDRAWHHIVKLVLGPHPALEDAHKNVIELDYGMKNSECSFECREALLFYVLQQLGLNQEDSTKSAKAQQITLKNRKELEPFLPKTPYR